MAMTEEELVEVQWAWKLFKTTEQLQQILLQRYHLEFIAQMERENSLREMEIQMPF